MDSLVAIALGISAMSLFLSSAALWPHSQAGLERARNGFLWILFTFLVVGVGTIGYRKMDAHRASPPKPYGSVEFVTWPGARVASDDPVIRESRPTRSKHDRLDLRPQGGIAVRPSGAGASTPAPSTGVFPASYHRSHSIAPGDGR